MACIVYQVDKKSGTKYAYESVSYWDKEKHQPRSKRKYLGKVDPETGEIIRSPQQSVPESVLVGQLRAEIIEKDAAIDRLQGELEEIKQKYSKLREVVETIQAITKNAMEK